MVRRWRKDQANLFNGELKMSAKRKTMGCFSPKYPELDQTLLDWFSEKRSHDFTNVIKVDDVNNSDGKASLKRQKSPENTTDTQGMSKFY
ncbi:hypothetical protein pdam_00023104 [Pocillopora damicornis]|uniref:Uncharacterized protein n=1 Tax=Pocillopora damicornis TaxID=46731 RepID=A0A3M6TW76_POCDA|nr:hypothetical protein pdam_00023104 [Pocillopora damicornis]